MASNDWIRENPKITGNIPKNLKNELDTFAKERGISLSKALQIILESHFDKAKLRTSSQLVENSETKSSQLVLNSIKKRLKSLETQVQKHSDIIREFKISQKNRESNPKVLNSFENSETKSSQPVLNSSNESSQLVPNRAQLTIFDGWLTTGEAYAELQKRGYEKSQGTFRRTLRESGVPPELEKLGLIADFEVRNAANPKDNSVRWLKIS